MAPRRSAAVDVDAAAAAACNEAEDAITLTRPVALISAAFIVGSLAGAIRSGLQPAQAPPPRATSAALDGVLVSSLVFMAADANKDGAVTADELKSAMEKWLTQADTAKSGAA